MSVEKLVLCTLMIGLGPALTADAYIGPGLGAGTIAVLLGILGSIVMALVAFIWYPVKRLLKKTGVIKPKQTQATE